MHRDKGFYVLHVLVIRPRRSQVTEKSLYAACVYTCLSSLHGEGWTNAVSLV